MKNVCRMLVFCISLLAGSSVFSADAMVEEAEKWVADSKSIYRDPGASGDQAAVFFFKDQEPVKRLDGLPDGHPIAMEYGSWMLGEKTFLTVQPDLGPGVYEITAYVTARPVEYMHTFTLMLEANGVRADANTAWFESSGTYIPMTLQVQHVGGKLPIVLKGCGATGFSGMRGTRSEAEQEMLDQIKREKKGERVGADSEARAATEGNEEENLGELDGTPLLSNIDLLDLIVACDRVAIVKLADLQARVSRVWVDKVHYRPAEKAAIEVDLEAVGRQGEFVLEVYEIWERDSHRLIHEEKLSLAKEKRTIAFTTDLAPVEFGRQILATVRPAGSQQPELSAQHLADPARYFPGSAFEVFGVSQNFYRIGITANGGPQDTAGFPREAAAAIMQANKLNYANYFERFAWAPSDFGEQASDKEVFFAGQTQYAGSITGMRTLIEEAHKVGVKTLTYANTVAAGADGVEVFRRHPEWFATDAGRGVSTDTLGTLYMERWLKNEYYAAPPLDGRWRAWYHFSCDWSDGKTDMVDYAADDIARAAKIFGWDGVRWDGHFMGQMARFKERMRQLNPDFIHGYNICFGDPGSKLFLPRGDWKDFHEAARGGGMMMDESLRDYSHTNWSQMHWTKGRPVHFYQAICREADYIRRIEGIPLFIMFDMASELDRIYNVLYGLAAGEIYTYVTTPGWWPYGNLTKWLTRYSAAVWTDARRVKDPAKLFRIADPQAEKAREYPLFWEESCWIRDVSPTQKQLHIRIVNPPRYPTFCDRAQTPPMSRRQVEVSVPVPEGVKVGFLMHASPDLVTGHELLPAKAADGYCSVTVPAIRTFSVLVFTLDSTGGPFAKEPYALTTPVEDAAAFMQTEEGKKMLAEEEQKAVAAGIARSQGLYGKLKEQGRFNYELVKNVDAEDEAKPETVKQLKEIMKRPDAFRIWRNGVLDVHHARGYYAWLNRVEEAIGLLGGGRHGCSYMIRDWDKGHVERKLDGFPATYPEIESCDIMILDNLHAEEIGLANRVMIKDFVAAGGGLLVFGGHFNLSCGLDHNTWLEEMLPVRIAGYRQFARDDQNGFALAPADNSFFGKDIDWAHAPAAATVDTSPLKAEAQVLLKAGPHPAIVARPYGKGRVILVAMNQHGDLQQSLAPYWEWKHWPRVVRDCLRWLGQNYTDKEDRPAIKRELNPNLPEPELLRVEADDLKEKEFSEKLVAACGNVIDRESARSLLACAIEQTAKVNDFEAYVSVAQSIGPYMDASFAPFIDDLLKKDLGELKAIGLHLVATTGDDAYYAAAKQGLAHKHEMVRREAILALSAFDKKPEAVKLIQEYVKTGDGFNFRAATMLIRLQVKGGLSQALALYPAHLRRVRDIKCIYMGAYNSRYGAMSFKLTPKEAREMERRLCQLEQIRRWANEDLELFTAAVAALTPTQNSEAVEALAAAENEDVIPLAYALIGRLGPEERRTAAPLLQQAKLAGIRLLVE